MRDLDLVLDPDQDVFKYSIPMPPNDSSHIGQTSYRPKKDFPTKILELTLQEDKTNILGQLQTLIYKTDNIDECNPSRGTALFYIVTRKQINTGESNKGIPVYGIIELLLKNDSDILIEVREKNSNLTIEQFPHYICSDELIKRPIDHINPNWILKKLEWAHELKNISQQDSNMIKQLWRGVEYLKNKNDPKNADYDLVNQLYEGFSQILKDKVNLAKAESLTLLLIDTHYFKNNSQNIIKYEIFPKLLDSWLLEEYNKLFICSSSAQTIVTFPDSDKGVINCVGHIALTEE
jgi:hypothetical protein